MKFSVLILIAVVVGTSAGRKHQSGVYKQTGGKTKVAETSYGKKAKSGNEEEPEYVTRDEFDSALNDLNSIVNQMVSDVSGNTATLSQVNSDIDVVERDIIDLQTNYDYDTVKQCQSGTLRNACDSHRCETEYIELPIAFSPYFQKPPRAIISVESFDDNGGTPVRLSAIISTISKSDMKIGVSTYSDSKIADLSLMWMACA